MGTCPSLCSDSSEYESESYHMLKVGTISLLINQRGHYSKRLQTWLEVRDNVWVKEEKGDGTVTVV